MSKKTTLLGLALSTTLAIYASNAMAKQDYHTHLDYIHVGGVYTETDSNLDATGAVIEFQTRVMPAWVLRGGYLHATGEGSATPSPDVTLDEIYGSLGYVLSEGRNSAHILEVGLNRSEIDVQTNTGTVILDSDFFGVGYRFWWHFGRNWETEFDVYGWRPVNSDEGDDDFQIASQLRVNYYFADHWGAGLQYRYTENADTLGAYIRYVF